MRGKTAKVHPAKMATSPCGWQFMIIRYMFRMQFSPNDEPMYMLTKTWTHVLTCIEVRNVIILEVARSKRSWSVHSSKIIKFRQNIHHHTGLAVL